MGDLWTQWMDLTFYLVEIACTAVLSLCRVVALAIKGGKALIVANKQLAKISEQDLRQEWQLMARTLHNLRNKNDRSFTLQILHWDINGHLVWDAVQAKKEFKMPSMTPNEVRLPQGSKVTRWNLNRELKWVENKMIKHATTLFINDIVDQYPN